MLSRALLSGQKSRALVALGSRATATTAGSGSEVENRRPVRQQPGKVRMGFIPEEWFQLFYKKTGVTGPYTFAFTFSTYLISKEIYVMEHEYYSGLSLAIMCVAACKLMGPKVAEFLDKEIDAYESSWSTGREDHKKLLQEQMDDEKKLQWSSEGQLMLVDAKRENVAMQLEAGYRQRMMEVYQQVKSRLDYQVNKKEAEQRVQQRNLVDYVVSKVRASITPDQEKQNIDKCIADLAGMAKA